MYEQCGQPFIFQYVNLKMSDENGVDVANVTYPS